MTSRFVTGDGSREQLPWGTAIWLSNAELTGSLSLCAMEVTFAPGEGHSFHRHPGQDELIVVRSGTVEQWIDQTKHALRVGDAVYIERDEVHATFNIGGSPAILTVVLSPPIGDTGYIAVDVAHEEPWASLR